MNFRERASTIRDIVQLRAEADTLCRFVDRIACGTMAPEDVELGARHAEHAIRALAKAFGFKLVEASNAG